MACSACRWGGIPRYVLEKTNDEEQWLLTQAITTSKLADVQDSLGGNFAHGSVSNRILHLRVDPDFKSTYMQMASPWVAEQVAFHLWSQERDHLKQFVSAAADSGVLGGVRGNLWEGMCHSRLAAGGIFRTRDLSTPSSTIESLHLSPSKDRIVFDDWSAVRKADESTYCRPRASNKAAIDSVRQPAQLYQMTVAAEHGINCAGLKQAVESMRHSSGVALYFVVPPDRFFNFKAQKIQQGVGVAELRQAVKQCALEIPF